MSERKITFLGTVNVDNNEVLVVPPDADADAIEAAIDEASAERAEAQARESRRLRKLFLEDESR